MTAAHALSKTVESALDESYLLLHRVAEHLVDVFRLKQFRSAIERDAKSAVIMDDREEANQILEHLSE